MDKFKNYADLAAHKKEGVDYSIVTHEVSGSNVAIVAPHGGMELNTVRMAWEIAANDYNLYALESLPGGGGFKDLHVTSTHFDEPRCLALVAKTDVTLTIHGSRAEEPAVFLSGRDKKLESKLAAAFRKAGIRAQMRGHVYKTGALPENICNKNRRHQGVQLEFSRGIRDNPALRDTCVRVIRDSLKVASLAS